MSARVRTWAVWTAFDLLSTLFALGLAGWLFPPVSFASFWSIAAVAMIVVALGLVIVELMLALFVRNRPGSAVILAFGGLVVAPFVALLLSTILINGFALSGAFTPLVERRSRADERAPGAAPAPG